VPRVFLGIGSNMDPEANLSLAISELQDRFGELQLSQVYRSSAWGFDGADFLNLVVAFDTDREPAGLLEEFEDVHALAGRERGPDCYMSRPLDIDLLMYGDLIDPDPPLRVPRRDVLEHSFVLGPLAEIAPDFRHPVTGHTLARHWQDFDRASHPLTPVEFVL
jgi:2-amino-4-hydroxy-6-hydroxymethyldihydropteridine diphosphokinase